MLPPIGLSRNDIVNMSKDTMNVNSAPVNRPGRKSGSTMRQKVSSPPAPRLADASSSATSTCCSAAVTARNANGKVTTMWLICRPNMLLPRPR